MLELLEGALAHGDWLELRFHDRTSRSILVEDGTATTSPEFCVQSTLYNVRLLFGFTTRSEALLAGLAAAA